MPKSEYTLGDLCSYLDGMRGELNLVRRKGLPSVNQFLMDYGNTLGVFPDEWKLKKNKVAGCTANVYIAVTYANGRVFYAGYADSKIVKGQLALLINGLNGLKSDEILYGAEDCFQEFVQNAEVRFSMTPTRTNSMGALFHFMRQKAVELLEGNDR